jgi:hypothetical protein
MNMQNTVYAQTARFDGSARALTEDEMRKLAPSIFATEAHESRSQRFVPIPTIEVLRGLQREGWQPVGVRQGGTRVPGKAAFTKHLIRLRRLDDDRKYQVGDTVFETLLRNANDGTAAYNLMGGLFRIMCQNSLVVQSQKLDEIHVKHSGDAVHKVIEGTYKVLSNAEAALAAPQDWSKLRLNLDERLALAEAAHVLRFGDEEKGVGGALQPDRLLGVRRQEDKKDDLWTTFNVVQENVIRGGQSAAGTDANMRRRVFTSREVKGIDDNVRLNKALFVLGQRMAELKA